MWKPTYKSKVHHSERMSPSEALGVMYLGGIHLPCFLGFRKPEFVDSLLL